MDTLGWNRRISTHGHRDCRFHEAPGATAPQGQFISSGGRRNGSPARFRWCVERLAGLETGVQEIRSDSVMDRLAGSRTELRHGDTNDTEGPNHRRLGGSEFERTLRIPTRDMSIAALPVDMTSAAAGCGGVARSDSVSRCPRGLSGQRCALPIRARFCFDGAQIRHKNTKDTKSILRQSRFVLS